MNEAYQRLRDSLPSRSVAGSAAFPTDPKRVKSWVEALPRANQQATLRQIAEALDSLRGARLEGALRLQLMEELRPSVLDGMEMLDKALLGSTFPLPPAKSQIAEQIQRFERELALAYRIAVVELCAPAGAVPFLRGGLAGQALQRAIYHASRELAGSYFLYRTPNEGTWAALNQLYVLAQSVKLEDKACDEPAERLAMSPRQAYAQALLFALSNPYRFSQRDQGDLWPITRDLALHVELGDRPPASDGFAIAVQEDRGPGYLPEEREHGRAAVLWLGIAPLRQALEKPLQGEVGGTVHVRFRVGHTLVAQADLLRRLRAGWNSASERGHVRMGAGHMLDTVIGISGLHYQLAGQVDFENFMRDVRGVGATGNDRERAQWLQVADANRAAPSRARVLDQSLGGYRIAWGREDAIRARVGEIIGLAPGGAGDEREWMVGAIRWLRYDPEGGVDAGIELLARRAQPVGLRSFDLLGVPRAPQRGIAIDSVRANGGSVHLLANAMLDAGAARLEVARPADPDDFEHARASVQECTDIVVLESAGDYLLLSAAPIESA